MAGGKASKTQGNFLYALSTKLPPTLDTYTQTFIDCIMKDKWTKQMQMEEGITFIKDALKVDGDKFVVD